MRKIIFTFALPTAALLVFAICFLGRGPNRVLNFERIIQNRMDPSETTAVLFDLKEWPQWHYQVETARWIGPKSAVRGAQVAVHLKIKEWKTADLVWEVIDWTPPSGFRLKLISDSTGKLLRAFQTIESGIEVQKTATGTSIRGYAEALTANFRIRLLSRLSERTVMHQVFYPDLNYFQFDLQGSQYHPAFDPPPPSR